MKGSSIVFTISVAALVISILAWRDNEVIISFSAGVVGILLAFTSMIIEKGENNEEE